MNDVTLISAARDCFVEITHRHSDSGSWIVRRWRKFLWFKIRVSSNWFNDEHQAIAFANEMKQAYDSQLGIS